MLIVNRRIRTRTYGGVGAGKGGNPSRLPDSSKTQADSWGLPGAHEDNELEPNPFPLFGLGAKVTRRRHLRQRARSGSTPAASTTSWKHSVYPYIIRA